MSGSILVINAGSSSLKFALFAVDSGDNICRGMVDWAGEHGGAELRLRGPSFAESSHPVAVQTHSEAVGLALQAMKETFLATSSIVSQIIAVGHRVVHGGTLFRESVIVDDSVRRAIAELAVLAPLHNPPALTAIAAALPGVPQVAVFDTAFFTSLPPKAFVYPLPYEWFADWGVRRFGFHGISHAYCAQPNYLVTHFRICVWLSVISAMVARRPQSPMVNRLPPRWASLRSTG
jgi:acetate kinase